MPHSGVALDDPRNTGIVKYFRPEPVTEDSVLRILTTAIVAGNPLSVLELHANKAMQAVESGPSGASEKTLMSSPSGVYDACVSGTRW
jgi:hypothetical protein